MLTKSIIVAVDNNNAIGKDNKLLCHLPNDLKYFKSVTSGHPVIMGRKTFDSLPNGPLPNRRNIVLSRQDILIDGCEVCHSMNEALELCKDEEVVFIIGGASIYKDAMTIADKLYVTYIDHTFENTDAFFPNIDTTEWEEVSRTYNSPDEKNRYAHSFVLYRRVCQK
ncbi:dihydrofolate reductase [Dysgonomonas sp. 520]|uniref:dihydrofolate reductase n=1 Tax=Dysgonomonas sp. 520 TaxID=2302931 RepID=UPI0013D4368C|nr:dihydrofolate reductase [Dysgonomonas sp. 520]NDW10014.1 dihydrofolate reductase [Dysgonomonas sp. 520]